MYKTHFHLDKPSMAIIGVMALFAVLLIINAVVLWGYVSILFFAPVPPVPPGPIDAATLGKAVELLQNSGY